jgi:hypothetical protein
VKLLLTQCDGNKRPITGAIYYGRIEIVKLFLAHHGNDLSYLNRMLTKGQNYTSNIHLDTRRKIEGISNEYVNNPIKIRNYYIREYCPERVGEYFILFVSLSDGYFTCKTSNIPISFKRFFEIIIVLPRELQELIANIMINSSDIIIKPKFIEKSIKKFHVKHLVNEQYSNKKCYNTVRNHY